MNFSKMNQLGQMANIKPRKSITELELNKEYQLFDIKAVRTSFGKQILVECKDFVAFLPSRFSEMTDAEICQLKETNITEWGIKYTGLKDYSATKQIRIIEFVKL